MTKKKLIVALFGARRIDVSQTVFTQFKYGFQHSDEEEEVVKNIIYSLFYLTRAIYFLKLLFCFFSSLFLLLIVSLFIKYFKVC